MEHNFWRQNGGPPVPLPEAASDANGFNHSDLSNNPDGRAACGFEPAPPYPDHDPLAERPVWDAQAAAWRLEAIPAPLPPPPPPPPSPLILTRLQFIGLAQAAGGMTDALFVQAKNDPAFEAFWAKFNMAENVQRDDKLTAASLAALEAANYLPAGASAVLAAWPTA